MNGPATEIPLVEDAETLVDEFRAHLRHLETHLTLLDAYRQERKILRALDRRGLDSTWARRELAARRKEAHTRSDEPDEAA